MFTVAFESYAAKAVFPPLICCVRTVNPPASPRGGRLANNTPKVKKEKTTKVSFLTLII
jgi:hypothetical protein